MQALKTSELQLVEVPNFSELAVNLRNYLFGVVGTLYNKEHTIVVKKAYEYRSAHYKGKDSYLIEITPEMKEYLEKVIAYKSNIWLFNDLL